MNFKFRAWDSLLKFFDDRVSINRNIFFIDDEDGTIKLDKERYIIQFYTGLKDKNNKDVYEGDVIKCYIEDLFGDNSGEKELFVKYAPPSFCFYFLVKNEEDCEFYWEQLKNVEIIGNILEEKYAKNF